MNLIDKLGGYEAAKVEWEKWGFDDFLNAQLLEYRREHNIFEAGDICKLKVEHDYELYRFIRIEGNRAYLQDRLGFTEFGINKDVVEHATDEEIKAGKRP